MGVLRITGGSLRGRKIAFPRHAKFRPSEARVREAAFNMLKDLVSHACAMDLFAGSGILGIEALSRGARFVTFVEEKGYLAKALVGNLRELGLSQNARVIRGVLPQKISAIEVEEGIDLVLLDPPYECHLVIPTLEALSVVDWLAGGSTVVVKHSPRERVVSLPAGFSTVKERRFGDSQITILNYNVQG